jgi:hypothetical protein
VGENKRRGQREARTIRRNVIWSVLGGVRLKRDGCGRRVSVVHRVVAVDGRRVR